MNWSTASATASATALAALAGPVDAALGGDRRALARLISLVENDPSAAPAVLARIHPLTGRARIIGVTGPPGVGKSTIVDGLTARFRAAGQNVGIVAVDPTSPFTGGALLGDRVRMQRWTTDRGVFIRSLATRGHLGGVSGATGDAIRLLDAVGFQVILVETVGAGQSEVEIMDIAHTVLVVLSPGVGDDVQAQKAGILEIADLLVVNKSDLPDAGRLAVQLETMLDLAPVPPPWRPPVLKVSAIDAETLSELVQACDRHFQWLKGEGRLAARLARRTGHELSTLIGRLASAEVVRAAELSGAWDKALEDVTSRRADFYQVALRLLREAGLGSRE
ncbi:MAG: methylmalonyl Co-A mutase-associated GTPase MeaB [Bacillota bacterium]|nr:methylmalonyl Co-A mutase-associated GTPase MeaB [Bacillota bacterium]